MKNTLKKLNFLITKRQRKLILALVFLLLIGMFLEAFGLGVLVPGLSMILDPEALQKITFLMNLKGFLPNSLKEHFIILFLIAICLLYFLKSIFLIFLTLKQNRFLNNVTTYISNNLFTSYLSQPYSFHIKRNASELIKNLQVETNLLHSLVSSIIIIFTEFCFVFSIVVTIIYIEPVGAISIGLFYALLSVLFFAITRKKLNVWGNLRQDLDNNLSKYAHEGLGGIKDLLILGKTSYFIDQYSNKNYLRSRVTANQGTLAQVPRYYLEFISILGLICFIISQLLLEKNINELFTVLGIFVAASFRIIPSINRIISAFQTVKFNMPSLDIIYNEIKSYSILKDDLETDTDFQFKKEIEFKNVSFSYSKNNKVINQVNLKIEKGKTIGIIGESGSGKSTLVDLLIGLHKPLSGVISADGINIFHLGQKWKDTIGYVSQAIYLADDSIKNNIALGVDKDLIDDLKINQILAQVQLDRFINSLELGVNTKVGERGVQLSGGQKQRIGIARALYNNSEILILDEATSALDSDTETQVMNTIINFKGVKTIIIIAHRLSTLTNVDDLYEVNYGNILKL